MAGRVLAPVRDGARVLLGPLRGTLLLFVTHASFIFINFVASVIDAVVLPFAAIATTYLYFDLRVATQGETAEEGARSRR